MTTLRMVFLSGSVVERSAVNRSVVGSNPTWGDRSCRQRRAGGLVEQVKRCPPPHRPIKRGVQSAADGGSSNQSCLGAREDRAQLASPSPFVRTWAGTPNQLVVGYAGGGELLWFVNTMNIRRRRHHGPVVTLTSRHHSTRAASRRSMTHRRDRPPFPPSRRMPLVLCTTRSIGGSEGSGDAHAGVIRM